MKTDLDRPQSKPLPSGDSIEPGQWYQFVDEVEQFYDEEEGGEPPEPLKVTRLACVTHLGSNYVGLEVIEDRSSYLNPKRRVLFDEFDDRYVRVDASPIIAAKVAEKQGEVQRLMKEVQSLTARLAVGPTPELASGATESQALAVVGSHQDMGDYKSDLVRAKRETLPDLFKQIERAHEALASWMSASVIPLKAQAKQMKRVIRKVDDRLLSIELYAGLSEEVEQILDGQPAGLTTKVHLMQRRHYMDEECLARYDAGGMDFHDLGDFDKWLARPDNFERILPHERCIVAFRVRRGKKDREEASFLDLLRSMKIDEVNKKTFLYIRNGKQLFRMTTLIEFDERLFPDLDSNQLRGKLWADVSSSDGEVITDDQYQGLVEEGDYTCSRYVEYSPDNVYYDDIRAKIEADIAKHNRIALILQGLLDRSPVLHPHPPWQLWTPEGFSQALVLVYDSSRALASGDLPDFEAYRRRLNASLKEGSVTVGQEDVWLLAEGEKEAERRLNRGGRHSEWTPTRFQPYGNPGPGLLAKVAQYSTRSKTCTYRWVRERLTYDPYGNKGPIPVSFKVPSSQLLNVSAYKPGDFRQFYDDPRTRQNYLKWAPLLMAAEDYHAGVAKVE